MLKQIEMRFLLGKSYFFKLKEMKRNLENHGRVLNFAKLAMKTSIDCNKHGLVTSTPADLYFASFLILHTFKNECVK